MNLLNKTVITPKGKGIVCREYPDNLIVVRLDGTGLTESFFLKEIQLCEAVHDDYSQVQRQA